MIGSRARREPSEPDSDTELYRAAGQGNGDAMALLYERHGGLIYRFSLRLIQDESIAEEVTQDVFLALLKHGDRFDPRRAALSTWMCGIARRLAWKHLKKRQQHAGIEMVEAEDLPANTEDPGILMSRGEAVVAVQKGIEALPPEFREAIILCEFEDLTYEDAALVIGVPIGTVRSRLHRAKARLALLLRGVGKENEW